MELLISFGIALVVFILLICFITFLFNSEYGGAIMVVILAIIMLIAITYCVYDIRQSIHYHNNTSRRRI